jgi:hypothetical protein
MTHPPELKQPIDDLECRRPVWDALSTLFLDTDTSLTRPRRAQVLAASEYSLDELEDILLGEVYPACGTNLLSIAGEWAGFDPQWLEERILPRRRSRLRRLSFGRCLFADEWRHTKTEVRLFVLQISIKSSNQTLQPTAQTASFFNIHVS